MGVGPDHLDQPLFAPVGVNEGDPDLGRQGHGDVPHVDGLA